MASLPFFRRLPEKTDNTTARATFFVAGFGALVTASRHGQMTGRNPAKWRVEIQPNAGSKHGQMPEQKLISTKKTFGSQIIVVFLQRIDY